MNLRSRTQRLLVVDFLVFSLSLTPTLAVASSVQLDPISISFPSPQLGFVLSLYDCAAKTCANLRSTNDAASSWIVVPTPNQLNKNLNLASWGTYGNSYETLTVHFADAKNGWIYGTVPAPTTQFTSNPNWVSRLWSTHDGGKTWQQIRLGPLSITGGVVQMATLGAWTYLFGGSNTTGLTYILATQSNMEQIERTNGDARRWYAIGRFLQLRGVRRMVCGRERSRIHRERSVEGRLLEEVDRTFDRQLELLSNCHGDEQGVAGGMPKCWIRISTGFCGAP